MLEIRNLTKCFGGLTAVSGLDLDVGQGEMVGLIGPNGAGKTTVFNLITGFLRPTGGRVVFDGKDLTGRKPHSIALAGMVRTFQAANVFPDFTVMENVAAACYLESKVGFWEASFHTRGNRRKEERVLKYASEIVDFLEMGALKDTSARNLPHGHKRMLGIAIALAARPRMLMLDEPLSGMNGGEVDTAIRLIRKIWDRGTAILLIEHNMRAAMNLCQRIVVLEMGRKIAEGTPVEVKANKRVIQAYLGTGKHAA
jgi:branched-chain amino acid transport system ATP-binding protein